MPQDSFRLFFHVCKCPAWPLRRFFMRDLVHCLPTARRVDPTTFDPKTQNDQDQLETVWKLLCLLESVFLMWWKGSKIFGLPRD